MSTPGNYIFEDSVPIPISKSGKRRNSQETRNEHSTSKLSLAATIKNRGLTKVNTIWMGLTWAL